jgi:hypothetical protein
MISLMLAPASSNSKLQDECSHGNGPPTRSQASSCPGPARSLVNYVTVTRPSGTQAGMASATVTVPPPPVTGCPGQPQADWHAAASARANLLARRRPARAGGGRATSHG